MAEIREALPTLAAELRATSCNVFLALGNEALFALTSKWGIDKYRGSILESTLLPGRKVVAAWHPANILRVIERAFVFHADVKRAVAQSAFPEIRRPKRTIHVNPSLDDAVSFIRSMHTSVTTDVECPIRQLDVIYCLGIGCTPDEAMVIPFTNSSLTPSERRVLIRELNEMYARLPINGQNIGFDIWRMETTRLFRIHGIEFDTMLAHHMLWPEAGTRQKDEQGKDNFAGGHDLGFINSIYTEEPYYKDEGKNWNRGGVIDWETLWYYNGKDVCSTAESRLGLLAELREFNQEDYFREHVLSLIRPVWAMQGRGMAIDYEALQKAKRRLQLEIALLQRQLELEIQMPCNVMSPVDLRYLIYDKLGYPVKKRTAKGGGASADKETLLTLSYQSPHAPIFRKILDIRQRRTLVSSFMGMEANSRGRYTAVYKIHGADSGRLSSTSSKDLDGRAGPQLQNIPKKLRYIFKAARGKTMITADLRRAEAMFVAYAAGEDDLIAIFNDPTRDLYIELAEEALGKKVGKNDIERECFKSVVHASNYGMGPRRFVSVLRVRGINIEDVSVPGVLSGEKKAAYFIEKYHSRFPRIRSVWQARIKRSIDTTRTLVSALGRRRFFMGRLGDEATYRVGFSFDPQATIVTITNTALRRLHDWGYDVIMQVHDSTGIEIEEERVLEGCDAVARSFHYPVEVNGRTLNIPIDLQVGRNWGPYDAVKNPEGMRECHGSIGTWTIPPNMGLQTCSTSG